LISAAAQTKIEAVAITSAALRTRGSPDRIAADAARKQRRGLFGGWTIG
jgi:hypothetical protein